MHFKGIIFDLGNVVFSYSFERTFETWASLTDNPAKEIRDRFKFDEAFKKFERNDISIEQFIDHVSKELRINFDRKTFEEGWNDIYSGIIPGINELLSALKNKYRIVGLTNTNAIHANVWPNIYYDTMQHFEKIYSSHEIRARKPEEQAFRIVLDHMKLDAGEILFLDDIERNIIAAKSIGMYAIQVTSFQQMIEEMKQIKITFD